MTIGKVGAAGLLVSTTGTAFGKSCSAARPKRPASSKSRGTKPGTLPTTVGLAGLATSTTCRLPV
jgi:hypothetical protein